MELRNRHRHLQEARHHLPELYRLNMKVFDAVDDTKSDGRHYVEKTRYSAYVEASADGVPLNLTKLDVIVRKYPKWRTHSNINKSNVNLTLSSADAVNDTSETVEHV